MLEKIGKPGYEILSSPDLIVTSTLREVLSKRPADSVVYYEVGVGIGATVSEVAKIMNNMGSIILFSLERELRELGNDLVQLGFNNVDASWGSPSKTYSGYHFQLAKAYIGKKIPMFDLAYVDGGHVFHLDAPAACVLKELCKPGGYILFDDYNWTIARSPSMNPESRPETAMQYDSEQIAEAHVKMVCKVIMDTDPRYICHGIKNDTAIYQRRV